MVSRVVRYRCEKCRKRFSTYREAESCELDHIVRGVSAGFRRDLASIFNPEKSQESQS